MWRLLSYLSLTECLVVVIVFLITYSYLLRLPWKRLPPGPPNFPLIGSLPYLGGDIRKCLTKLANKYGDVFMVYFGPTRFVILHGYDVIKQAYIAQAGDFEDRSHIVDDLTHHLGITSTSGEHWKQQRRILVRAMKDFGLSGNKMQALVQEECRRLTSVLHTVSGVPYDIEPVMTKAVSSIISRLFGRHWDYDDPEFIRHIKISDEAMKHGTTGNPVWSFKLLKYIPGDPFSYHKVSRLWSELLETHRNWVLEQQKHFNEKDEPSDIIGLYLKELKQEEGNANCELSVEGLVHLMSQIYLAGTDTTSNTLVWIMLQLILNPDIQKKVHAEIDAIIGRDRSPRMQDRYDMPYTEAVISEVQRWCDLVPLSVPKYTRVDRKLRGYDIPAHTTVMPNLTSVHQDPKLWPQPHLFDPERFIENGKYKAKEQFIPFSLGKRSCLGEGLARMELFLFVTHLLQTFTFSVPVGQPKPSTEGDLGFTYNAKPFELMITPRE